MKQIRRIVLTGAESSAKTTLTRALAEHFCLPAAEEFARLYLEKHGPDYDRATLLQMSQQHRSWQTNKVPPTEPLGIFDTDLINYKIWSEEVFGDCPKEILHAIACEGHHCYLVCAPDLPWEPDPLRESPDQLEYLFERHISEIEKLNRPLKIVRGLGDDRLHNAIAAFEQLAYQPPM